MTGRRRRGRHRLAVAVLALLATGCELQAVLDVDLRRDGSGTLAVTLAADEELAMRARARDLDPIDGLVEAGQALAPDGWRTDDAATPGGGRAVTLSTRFDDPADLERLSAELAGALAAPELDPLDPFTLTVDGRELRVDGAAALQPTQAVAEAGLDPQEAVARMREAVDYRIRLHLPGTILETSASEQRDGTLTWVVGPGDAVDVLAVARQPAFPWPAVAGVAGTAALGAALWVVARRRRAPPTPGRPGG